MAFLNIVTLYGNIDEPRHSISDQFIDLIAFSETWLNHNITDNLINLENYDLIRRQNTKWWGRVLILKKFHETQNSI